MDFWLTKVLAMLQSRRFQAAIIGFLIIVFQDVIGMTEEQAQTVAALIMSWIIGDSLKNTTSPKLDEMRYRSTMSGKGIDQ